MSIDLRTDKHGGTWVRRFGDHEAAGIGISLNDRSAHVTLADHEIMFSVDREDVPTAWGPMPIDVVKLRAELLAAIVRHMSVNVLEELFGELIRQRQGARREGERAAQAKIQETLREVLGL